MMLLIIYGIIASMLMIRKRSGRGEIRGDYDASIKQTINYLRPTFTSIEMRSCIDCHIVFQKEIGFRPLRV